MGVLRFVQILLPFCQYWSPSFCVTSVILKLLTNPQRGSKPAPPSPLGDKSFSGPPVGPAAIEVRLSHCAAVF